VDPGKPHVARLGAPSLGSISAFYFEMSYRLLTTPTGRDFLRAAAGPRAPAVHGYATERDLDALVDALRPTPDDVVIDLGCGIGEAALAVHERTGCAVIGVDAAPRAIAEARRRAAAATASGRVRFELGDLTSPPRGTAAFALDSLMFVPCLPRALGRISRSLEPPGRVFVTFVDHRGLDQDAFARSIASGGVRVEAIDDVTDALRDRSRHRALTARRMLRDAAASVSAASWLGRLGLLLVLAEETIVTRRIEAGALRRWRFTVSASPWLPNGPGPVG
jgi:SAM-dependent methyltransferase